LNEFASKSPTSAGKPARWAVFSSAPHRLLFTLGAIQTIAGMLWWLLRLTDRTALPVPVVPDAWIHLFIMLYGLFPLFIFGFLFTVYPRWLGGEAVPRALYIAVFCLLAVGITQVYAGAHLSVEILAFGATFCLAGWLAALAGLLRVYRRASQRGLHERYLNLALAAGALGIVAWLAAVARGDAGLITISREIGVWLFLLPVVFLVSHRMIPFFSQSALVGYLMVRPPWSPPLVLVAAALHVLLDLGGLPQWRFLADAPLAVAALHHSWVWQFRRSFHSRLLAMLHIAFLWLGLGMTLYSLQSLALLVTGADLFGRAPLHALGIGFFTGMVVAMASRVTLGHSGHSLVADRLTWAALGGINVAAVLRVAAEWMPQATVEFNVLAALAWLAALVPWVWDYAPMLLRPRVDGRPG